MEMPAEWAKRMVDEQPVTPYTPQVGDVSSVVWFKLNGAGRLGLASESENVVKWWSPVDGMCRGSFDPGDTIVGVSDIKVDDVTEKQLEALSDQYDALTGKKKQPEPEFPATYAERQAQWVAHHGLKVGDKVRVVRKFEDDEGGCISVKWDFNQSKAAMQDKECEIHEIKDKRIRLWTKNNADWWDFPYFVLEPVKD